MALFRLILDGDVRVVDGAVQLTQTRGEYVRVKVRQRFRFFLGEWFRDTRAGVPYVRAVLGRTTTNPNAVRAIFLAILRTIPEIANVQSFDMTLDKATRRATIAFVASLADGDTLVVSANDDDFVLTF